jgi:hypothetical protein
MKATAIRVISMTTMIIKAMIISGAIHMKA